MFLRFSCNRMHVCLVNFFFLFFSFFLEFMAQNDSGNGSSTRDAGLKIAFLQVLILLFLFVNSILITTFFTKDIFYRNMRYILFVVTLMSDSIILILTNVLLILTFWRLPIPMWICFIIFIILSVCSYVTPLTLTVMSLERYVAICMPLRHADLCFPSRALHCILIVHSLSLVPSFIVLSTFLSLGHYSVYTDSHICSVELFIVENWQGNLRSGVGQFYFSFMLVSIIFCYIKIIKIARSASGENKQVMWKGMRTVLLHAIQLLLSLSQMWCPIVENAVLKIDWQLFLQIRFMNYIMFSLCPRCLSPLIYGVRDETFLLALKSYAVCGFLSNKAFEKSKEPEQT